MYLKDKTWKVTGVFLKHGTVIPRYHVRLTDVSKDASYFRTRTLTETS
jgi:hypothetical protein